MLELHLRDASRIGRTEPLASSILPDQRGISASRHPLNPEAHRWIEVKAGDKVLVVYTPRAQDELGESTGGRQIQAEVVGIREVPDTSDVVLDVTVASNQAAELADIIATQRVAVILQGA